MSLGRKRHGSRDAGCPALRSLRRAAISSADGIGFSRQALTPRDLGTKSLSSPRSPLRDRVHRADSADNCSSATALEIPPVPASPDCDACTAASRRAFRAPYVEIVEARQPERPLPFLVKQIALSRITAPSLWQQGPGRALFQYLHHCRRTPHLRFGNQKVDVLGHHNIAHHHEVIALACLFEYGEEEIARPW